MWVFLFALGAAMLFSVSTLIQHRAAGRIPTAAGGPIRLFLRLLRSPNWLGGQVFGVGALGLQLLALSRGSLVVVQAVLACGIVMTLGLEAVLHDRPLRTSGKAGMLCLVAGIGMLVGIGRPGGGSDRATLVAWSAATAVTIAVVSACGLFSRNTTRENAGSHGAALAFGAGVCFALDTAFLKSASRSLGDKNLIGIVLLSAIGYLSAAVAGNVLGQRAYQIAPLVATMPTLTAIQPIAGVAFGTLLYGEQLRGGPAHQLAGVVGAFLLTLGSIATARAAAG